MSAKPSKLEARAAALTAVFDAAENAAKAGLPVGYCVQAVLDAYKAMGFAANLAADSPEARPE